MKHLEKSFDQTTSLHFFLNIESCSGLIAIIAIFFIFERKFPNNHRRKPRPNVWSSSSFGSYAESVNVAWDDAE